MRDDLEVARDELAKARAKLKASRAALADRLVELYKADQPDALTVVLEADGFADLLERTEFLERISERDGEIVTEVRILKARAEKAERRLDELEDIKVSAAETILERRDDIAAARDRLASAQGELRAARNGRQTALAQVRESRVALEGDLRGARGRPGARDRPAAERLGRRARRPDPPRLGPAHLAGRAARWCRPSASAGGACTRASTSPCPRAPRSAPRTRARWS